MLNELIDAKASSAQMFPPRDPQKSARLMNAMDNISGRLGPGMVIPAVSGIDRRWRAKAEFLSPRYTTRLEERNRD
ncbi:DUF4113 domain-containing protein [Edaphobacter sp. DSM 109919]|uniref:DUF4113 domain-containing protein n=1 Tax=Edaphobacter paludis TaxID=3035702 RepID=A0AAU7D1Z8_9BACT